MLCAESLRIADAQKPLDCGVEPASFLRIVNTHRLLSGSFLGVPYRILDINHKKELLRSLWANHNNNTKSSIVLISCARAQSLNSEPPAVQRILIETDGTSSASHHTHARKHAHTATPTHTHTHTPTHTVISTHPITRESMQQTPMTMLE